MISDLMHAQEYYNKLQENLNNIYDENEIRSFLYILLEQFFGIVKTDLIVKDPINLSSAQITKLDQAVRRLSEGEPIQHIIGFTEFYDRRFKVSSDVLIPRPETEELVHWIISDHQTPLAPKRILDIGCGSGCISIITSLNIQNSKVYALDNDPSSLEICQENIKLNSAQVETIEANILNYPAENLPENLDIIVSNPPYVLDSDKKNMHINVLNYEPHNALFVPDHDPLLFYTAIARFGLSGLNTGGLLYFEIHEKMGKKIVEMLQNMGYGEIIIKKDIHNKDRMVRARNER